MLIDRKSSNSHLSITQRIAYLKGESQEILRLLLGIHIPEPLTNPVGMNFCNEGRITPLFFFSVNLLTWFVSTGIMLKIEYSTKTGKSTRKASW